MKEQSITEQENEGNIPAICNHGLRDRGLQREEYLM